jgi:hypothetical protein
VADAVANAAVHAAAGSPLTKARVNQQVRQQDAIPARTRAGETIPYLFPLA